MREFLSTAMRKLHRMNEEQLHGFIRLIADEYALFDAMMDSLTNGVIILNSKAVVIKVNRAASRILGVSITEGDERPVWRLIHTAKLASFIRTVIQNEEGKRGVEFVVSNDTENQYIEVSVLPLVRDKKVKGTIITVNDITRRKREEIAKRRLESLASLTNLAAAVAHEIKNPLAAISIHVQLLRKNFKACNLDINGKAQKHLNVVEEEINRLNKIVVDFLFAVRPLQCEFLPVSVNGIIKTLIHTFTEEFGQCGIAVVQNLVEDLPAIQGDERFLRLAFMNILTNAKAAMPNGGKITVCTALRNDMLCISFADTGQGIAPEMQHKIFEPYFTTKAEGTGLGLTMTYKVVKEHSGDIQVHSEIDRGTCFTITLPITQTSVPLLTDSHRSTQRVDTTKKSR